MKRVVLSLGLFLVMTLPALAADACKAVALRDVPAVDNPDSVLKRGTLETGISQYRVDKKTHEGSLCAHGGYCYPTHLQEDGKPLEVLKLLNCQIGEQDGSNDPDDIYYNLDVIRSKLSPAALKEDDADNRLLALGLCSACAGTAAHLYVSKPHSACARLVKDALEGNPQALKSLSGDSSDCEANSAPRPAAGGR